MKNKLLDSQNEFLRLRQNTYSERHYDECLQRSIRRFEQASEFKAQVEASLAQKVYPKHLSGAYFDSLAQKLGPVLPASERLEAVYRELCALRREQKRLDAYLASSLSPSGL